MCVLYYALGSVSIPLCYFTSFGLGNQESISRVFSSKFFTGVRKYECGKLTNVGVPQNQ
jgi:hypothetical protein